MSYPAASTWLAPQRRRIARMIEAETPFLEVEQVIARSALPPDQKSELWTFAWALMGAQRQREHAEWIMKSAYSAEPPAAKPDE